MSKLNGEFRAGNPRPKPVRSQKWDARQRVLRSDRYREWTPVGELAYPRPGRGVDGESQT